MKVYVANPRGFCAGVQRAVLMVERAIEAFGAPIYVRHAVVHNRSVVEGLQARGALFVESLAEVPRGARVIFSAHGVSPAVTAEAQARGLLIFDATCPLVLKVQREVVRWRREGYECCLIGHAGHPEVEGIMGQVTEGVHLVENEMDVASLQVCDPARLAVVTQTTLSVDDTRRLVKALQMRFPLIRSPRTDDICYATQNRQDAVKSLAQSCAVVLVIGSVNSSNSRRLYEVAQAQGARAFLIDGPHELIRSWFEGVDRVGVTAGASAPEELVQAVIAQLRAWGASGVWEQTGPEETVVFRLPAALVSSSGARHMSSR